MLKETSRKLVIQIMFGGLGDHLFFTPIPRLAKESGKYDEVYISNQSEFRHPDYKRLIWDCNPYIDGYTDEKGLFKYVDVIPIMEAHPELNILDAKLWAYNLYDNKPYHEPELYWKPKIRPDLADAIIYDPNYVSNVGKNDAQRIEKYFAAHQIKVAYQMKVRGETNFPISTALQVLETPTLEDYCSVIISCKAFYCLTSGGATLASALGKPCTAFYGYGQGAIFHHSKQHQYVYIGDWVGDYKLWQNALSRKVKKEMPTLHKMLRQLIKPR